MNSRAWVVLRSVDGPFRTSFAALTAIEALGLLFHRLRRLALAVASLRTIV